MRINSTVCVKTETILLKSGYKLLRKVVDLSGNTLARKMFLKAEDKLYFALNTISVNSEQKRYSTLEDAVADLSVYLKEINRQIPFASSALCKYDKALMRNKSVKPALAKDIDRRYELLFDLEKKKRVIGSSFGFVVNKENNEIDEIISKLFSGHGIDKATLSVGMSKYHWRFNQNEIKETEYLENGLCGSHKLDGTYDFSYADPEFILSLNKLNSLPLYYSDPSPNRKLSGFLYKSTSDFSKKGRRAIFESMKKQNDALDRLEQLFENNHEHYIKVMNCFQNIIHTNHLLFFFEIDKNTGKELISKETGNAREIIERTLSSLNRISGRINSYLNNDHKSPFKNQP